MNIDEWRNYAENVDWRDDEVSEVTLLHVIDDWQADVDRRNAQFEKAVETIAKQHVVNARLIRVIERMRTVIGRFVKIAEYYNGFNEGFDSKTKYLKSLRRLLGKNHDA